mmetsp:Transcript_27391/g.87950  ORF Transcript_27391/g.87950 Transcript_27391/m.87950 type:complete len:286 (+) Transcript_27391:187-1044(+)
MAGRRRRGYLTHEGSCTPQPSSYPRSARAVSASAHTSAATATPISSGSPPRSRGRVALWCTTLYADYWATHYHFLSPLLPLLNPLWWQARCERQAFTSLALPAVAQVHDPRQPVDVHDESGRTVNVACVSVSRPSVHSAPPLASPPRAAAQAAANSTSAIGRARPRDEPAPCTKLSSSRWEVPSGGALQPSPLAPGSRGGRSWDECCDACVAAGSACGGFNWAARDGCALFALHAIDDLHTTLFAIAGVRREAVPRVSEALVGLARRSRPKAKPTTALAPRRDPV